MNKETVYKFNGIWIILLNYLSWCFMTISYRNVNYLLLAICCTGVAFGLYVITIPRYLCELKLLPYLAAVFFAVGIGQIIHINSSADIVLSFTCLIWGVTSFALYIKFRKNNIEMWSKTIAFVNKYKWLLCLLILQLILAYDSNIYQFKWDGILYYQTCQDLSLTSISSLAIYGHIAQTYGAFVAIASLFINNVGLAMILMNMVLLVTSTIYFYRLVKLVVPGKKEELYILATSVFAFSPFYLGMAGYHNLDFYLQCLFPVVLYYTLAKKWIQQTVAALLFCFTKEPAVIIYAGMCIGGLLIDWFNKRELKFPERFKKIFGTVHYYYMMIPGVLWFVTYKLLGPWSAGNSSSGFDMVYILNKLKVLYCLQFNWVFTIILICGICLLCLKKRIKEQLWWLLPVLAAQTFFTIFSCLLQTVNHPRYSDSTMLTLYLITVVLMLQMRTQSYNKIGVVSLSVLLLISNYRTFDPVSRLIFTNTNIGDTSIITTESIPLGDSAIYNKQALWAENVMNQAIGDALKEDTMIVLPAIGNSTYSFDGASEVAGIENGYYMQTQYWDENKAKRVVLPDEDVLQYNLYFVLNDSLILDSIPREKGQNISFLYYDDAGKEYLDVLSNSYSLVNIEDYHYRGWTLHRAVLKQN